jgi:hypothetical protein
MLKWFLVFTGVCIVAGVVLGALRLLIDRAIERLAWCKSVAIRLNPVMRFVCWWAGFIVVLLIMSPFVIVLDDLQNECRTGQFSLLTISLVFISGTFAFCTMYAKDHENKSQ